MTSPAPLVFQATDRHQVSALTLRPRGAVACLVLGHGAGAGMHHPFMEAVAHGLADHRIASLRYQFPYTEEGRRAPDGRATLLSTVRNAVGAARLSMKRLPMFAGGKSMGGRMTTLAAADRPLPGVRGLAFLGFPLHPPARPGVERATHLSDIPLPMLFVQGDRDKLCDLDLLDPVLGGLGRRATLHVVEGADHGFGVLKRSGRTDAEALAELIDTTAAWIRRQL